MSWGDNFQVYLSNLSPVYIFSVIVSILAVIGTALYQKYDKQKGMLQSSSTNAEPSLDNNSSDNEDEAEGEVISPIISGEFGGVLGRIKAAKQRVLQKKLLGDDCLEEQKELEKKTEKEQLEAIWNLLQKQEDKFLLGSKLEMQEQLRLYRS